MTLHAVLQPSTDEPGALDPDRPGQPPGGQRPGHHRQLRLHPSPGRSSCSAVVDFNSFTEFGEQTELSLYHAFPNSQNFGQGSTEVFLGSSGLKLRVYGGYGQTDTDRRVRGRRLLTAPPPSSARRFTYPVIRSRQQNLNVYRELRRHPVRHQHHQQRRARARPATTRCASARIGADYARSDLLLGDDRGAVNSSPSVRMSQGCRSWAPQPDGNSPTRRAPAKQNDFFKFDFETHPHADAVQSVAGCQRGADGPAHRPVYRRHAAAGGTVLSRRAAVSPAATMPAR